MYGTSILSYPALFFPSFYVNYNLIYFLSLSVRVVDGKLYHPDGVWDPETIYVTVYSKRE
jgi:hypothetical protein